MKKATEFHHAETQADHATSQPLAMHAFLQDVEYLPTADLMLLAMSTNQAGDPGIVPKLLLADAAVCLLLEYDG